MTLTYNIQKVNNMGITIEKCTNSIKNMLEKCTKTA